MQSAATFPNLSSNDKPMQENRGSSPRIFAQSPDLDKIDSWSSRRSALIEDVFVCCTSFLRMYFHRVSSRHWPSPLTHQDAARITQGLLLTSSRIYGKEPKEARRPAPHNRYRDGVTERPQKDSLDSQRIPRRVQVFTQITQTFLFRKGAACRCCCRLLLDPKPISPTDDNQHPKQ